MRGIPKLKPITTKVLALSEETLAECRREQWLENERREEHLKYQAYLERKMELDWDNAADRWPERPR